MMSAADAQPTLSCEVPEQLGMLGACCELRMATHHISSVAAHCLAHHISKISASQVTGTSAQGK